MRYLKIQGCFRKRNTSVKMKNISGSNPYIGQMSRRLITDNIIPFCVPIYVAQTAAKNITMLKSVERLDRYSEAATVIRNVITSI